MSSPLSQKVFQTHKDMVIKKTVAQLPLPAVLPLLEEVSPVFVNDGHNLYFYLHEPGSMICCCFLFFILDHKKAPGTPFYVSRAFTFQIRRTIFLPFFILKAFLREAWCRNDCCSPQGRVNDAVAQGCAHAPHVLPGIGEWLGIRFSYCVSVGWATSGRSATARVDLDSGVQCVRFSRLKPFSAPAVITDRLSPASSQPAHAGQSSSCQSDFRVPVSGISAPV